MRDPWGIRPAYYFQNEEIVIVTSERPAIQTVLNVNAEDIHEIPPGYAVIVKHNNELKIENIRGPFERKACSFERIYFSRGSDAEIYNERKKLGELLTPQIIEAVDGDLDNSVFSFIPNTAEIAFYGMVKGIENQMIRQTKERILNNKTRLTEEELDRILLSRPKVEKVALKDIKLRTFISQDKGRDDLVGHVYDITYGTIRKGVENLVIIDDSIVRGTTLKYSIIKILDRLQPKRIVIVSSSPQIRYPDCYGIDMAKLGDFIAFKAVIELLKSTGNEALSTKCTRSRKPRNPFPRNKLSILSRTFTGLLPPGKFRIRLPLC
jgi:amidophosphoribosyltransferase